MVFYQLVTIGLLLLNLPVDYKRKNYYYYFAFFITFLVLSGIAGLKSVNVGSDTPVYESIFYQSPYMENSIFNIFSQRFEGGYLILNKFLFNIYPNVQILFITIAVIVIVSWLFLISRVSRNIALSIFIIITFRIYSMLLSNLRQSLAMALILVAFYLIHKRRIFSAVVVTLIAGTIHVTAFIFLLYILLRRVQVNRRIISLGSIIAIIGYISFNYFFNIGISFFSKFSSYETNNVINNETNVLSILSFLIVFLVFVLGTIVIRKNKNTINYEYMNELNLLILLACVFSFIALQTSMFNRFTIYFSMFIVFYIPAIISFIKRNNLRYLIVLSVVVAFFTYNFVLMYYRPEWNYIVPYTVFWQNL